MGAEHLELSIALPNNDRTRPIIDGRVKAKGITLYPTVVHPSEMFWRQLKYKEFAISEMSMSSLTIATAGGNRDWVAIPVFSAREFFHTRILVHNDSGIKKPEDLKGKRVGVPEYQQTAAIWGRGVLQHEFGVKPSDMEFFMERTPEKSHGGSTGFAAPPGVTVNRIPESTNIGEMLMKGELDATLLYLTDKNLVDRSRIEISDLPVRRLFPDMEAEQQRYYNKTGIFPINHTIVIRRDVHEKYPWVALNMFTAFSEAKQMQEDEAKAVIKPYMEVGLIDPKQARAAFAADPKSYGFKNARKVLETITDYVHEQGLCPRKVQLDEIFAPACLEL
ncbi:MAG: hypothetical protein RLZ98_1445 [Pseudomonadota bacterium]|jgi:4,5-dihydroxyphthalate decarboxylase